MRAHEQLMIEETRREATTWRMGEEMESAEPFMRLTLNIILRAVLGAEGAHLEQLRRIMPPMVELGAKLTASPFAEVNVSSNAPPASVPLIKALYCVQ